MSPGPSADAAPSALARPSVRRAALVVAAYFVVYLAWQVQRWGGPGAKVVIGDLAFVPLNLAAILTAWSASRRGAAQARLRRAWRLLAVGFAAYLLGDLLQLVYELAGNKPYPSVADVAYLSFPVLAFAGLLQFPTARPSSTQRAQLVIDCATVALGCGAVIWYLVLGPATLSASGSLVQKIFSIAYPMGDLIVGVGLAFVLFRNTMRSSRQALRWLCATFAVWIVADLVYGWLALHRTYSGGDRVDILWMAGIGLALLAGVAQERSPAGETVAKADGARCRTSWTPWLAVAVVLGLVAFSDRHDAFFPNVSLIATAVAVVALVMLRQLLGQRELLTLHSDLGRAHDELAALATTDPLTGLPNHRALVDAIDHELHRAERYHRPYGVLFVDIDHFKTVNDTHGHAAGDSALREVGAVMRRALRTIDIAGRWGGEEFVILLPESDANAARATAERIRAAMAAHQFAVGGGTRLTCSVGAAAFPEHGTGRDGLVAAADDAMYAAKRLGRNQALMAGDAAVTAIDAHARGRDDQALMGAVNALAALVDARDHYTGEHATEVSSLAVAICGELGCDPEVAHAVRLAARLHDVGKVAVPDAVFQKPGRLTEEEWRIMQTHSAVGADVVSCIPSLGIIAPLIRGHHERFDGDGYPDRLAGEQIPLGARIIAAADAFSAMTTARPYHGAQEPTWALTEMRRCSGGQFDPAVVDALVRVHATRRHERVA